MARRDEPRDPDPDDWFAEPDVSTPRRRGRRAPPAAGEGAPLSERGRRGPAEDWLGDGEGPPSGGGRIRIGPLALTQRAALVAAGLVLVLLIGLAAGGVFSGGGSPSSPATTTRPGTQTTTTTPPEQAAVQGPTTALRIGDKGAQVKALQRALTSLGYSPGKVDGQYGPSTAAAVARFQKAQHLAADGILGTQTLAALGKALRNSG